MPAAGSRQSRVDGTPVFIGCSDVDPHIPVERVRETHEAFLRAGAASEMQLYPGMPHTVNSDEIARTNEILRRARS
ncbi:MAG: alpha/beta hydrolase [Spirochaetaceae bacterium]